MKTKLNRRTLLRASGVAIALPLLHCMNRCDAVMGRDDVQSASDQRGVRRLLAINAPLGLHTPNLFPEKAGKEYEVTPYLESLQPLREKFSILSGLMHPDVDGGHTAENSFLTGAAHPGQPSFQNTISVDQLAAEQIGHRTRYPSLVLSANNTSLSFTRAGIQIPSQKRPSQLFADLFLDGNETEKAARMRNIEDGQSVMDLVREQTKRVTHLAGKEDNQTLDQYLTSVRELEQRLVQAAQWSQRPKPRVDYLPPTDIVERENFTGRMRLMYDMIFLAFQTDSTRLITFQGAGGHEVVQLDGVDDGWHNLSHHGRDPAKIEMLTIIEKEEIRLFAELLRKLDSVQEGEHCLLDQTAVLMGSNLGNASSHSNSNLPIIAAGGRFQHGQHLKFDASNSPPLCNLLVNYLQFLGVETDQFSSATGTLTGL